MAAETPRELDLEFVIAYPREAEVGKRYLMTVDVRARGPVTEWPYAQEEYALYCMVDSEPAFTNEPVGQTAVVLHRFGGTYGPARFVLTAREPMDEASLRLTLVNAAGLPLRKLELTDIRVTPPAPRQRPPPIEVRVALRRERGARYHVSLSSEVFGHIEHTTREHFGQLSFDELVQTSIERTIHSGTELFQKLFWSKDAQRAWRDVLKRARQEERPVRLYTDVTEPLDFEKLYDPERRSFFVLNEQPRIRVVRIDRESPSAQLKLPPRPSLMLAALALDERRHGASLLMTLARETERDYDVSLFGPDGPIRLREVVSALPPPVWTPALFLPYCHTRLEDLDPIPGIHGPELLHLVVSGLDVVEQEEPQDQAGIAIQLLMNSLMVSGSYQFAFVQACHPHSGRSTESHFSQTRFFPGQFSTTTGGLAALIANIVPLDAEHSTSLAVSFYRRLAEGQPLDEALQGGPPSNDLTPLFMNLWARPGALEPVRLAEAKPTPKPQPSPRQAPANSLGWLFLSNVLSERGSLAWENATQALLDDVERLHEKSGPWDLVLCAGDLTRTGTPQEFELTSNLFTALKRRLVALGMNPLFLTVPGNHDGALDLIRNVSRKLSIAPSLTNWQPLIEDAFEHYSTVWQNRWPPSQEGTYRRGLIPGDFAMTLIRNGLRWGIIGLNNVLTHWGDTEFPRRQFDAVCDGDFAAWSHQHDACLLLAHDEFQGVEEQWLSKAVKSPFILHLTGRSHDPNDLLARTYSSPFIVWHGRTLFPDPTTDLPSGYFAGRLTLEGEGSRLRVWPRMTEHALRRHLSAKADWGSFKLAEDEGFELTNTVQRTPAPRTSEDWAIVVGISHYPELGDLEGPNNDATAFHDWLLKKAGVPPEHLQSLLSSDFQAKEKAQDARPTAENIESLFEQLIFLHEENEERGVPPRVGRRLYIYLAGHGFMSSDGHPALLTANARRRVPHHIPGWTYANYLAQAGYFDEILLFMDCTSLDSMKAALRSPPYSTPRVVSDTPAKLFCALSALPRTSRAQPAENRKVQGVFTQALLSALNGRASDEHGRITGTSLANYLNASMREFLAPEEMENPDIFKQPQIIYDPSPDAELVIVTEPEASYWLAFRFAPSLRGQRVRLMHPQLDVVSEFQLLDPTMQFEYRGGTYLLDVSGELRMFTLREDSVIRLSQDGDRIRFELEPFGGNE